MSCLGVNTYDMMSFPCFSKNDGELETVLLLGLFQSMLLGCKPYSKAEVGMQHPVLTCWSRAYEQEQIGNKSQRHT